MDIQDILKFIQRTNPDMTEDKLISEILIHNDLQILKLWVAIFGNPC